MTQGGQDADRQHGFPQPHHEKMFIEMGLSVSVFYTNNKQGLQDHAFPIFSWSHEQEHYGFILVRAPRAKVIALRLVV
jgi:hypothetical protein